LCPLYFGSLSPGATFDPDKLGGFVLQIKNKAKGATLAEKNVGPAGIPRDLDQPLPYLVFVMELGNESSYQDTQSKIKTIGSQPLSDGGLRTLTDNWVVAKVNLLKYRNTASPEKKIVEKLKKDVELRQLAMEGYNRYSIFARGASPDVYGILNEANIAKEFATLLAITTPSPTAETVATQHMRPLERLDDDDTSEYTAWMSEFVTGDKM
jgi:hypothetical protein